MREVWARVKKKAAQSNHDGVFDSRANQARKMTHLRVELNKRIAVEKIVHNVRNTTLWTITLLPTPKRKQCVTQCVVSMEKRKKDPVSETENKEGGVKGSNEDRGGGSSQTQPAVHFLPTGSDPTASQRKLYRTC